MSGRRMISCSRPSEICCSARFCPGLVLTDRDPRQAEHALKASISLARGRSLQSAFDPILRAIGESMDSTVVALRSKALRALGSIVVIDPDVLAMVR
jgi:hypothetical protein